jgi:hypothetical protein
MLLAIPTVAKSTGSEKSDFRVFNPLSKELVLAPQVPTSFLFCYFLDITYNSTLEIFYVDGVRIYFRTHYNHCP